MPERAFPKAWSKLKWANKKVMEVNDALNAFLQTDFYTFGVERDDNTGHHVLRFKANPFPGDIGHMIGDALANLRRPLDYIIVEIVKRANRPAKWAKFPAGYADRDKLIAALNGGEMKVAGQHIVDLIVDVIQPYPGGHGHALSVLHDLDIGEKHFGGTPTVSVTGCHVSGTAGGTTFERCTFVVVSAAPGSEIGVINAPENFEFKGDCQPIFDVQFADGPFQRRSIVPTLDQLGQLVAGTLEAIEKAYLAGREEGDHSNPPEPSEPPPPAP